MFDWWVVQYRAVKPHHNCAAGRAVHHIWSYIDSLQLICLVVAWCALFSKHIILSPQYYRVEKAAAVKHMLSLPRCVIIIMIIIIH